MADREVTEASRWQAATQVGERFEEAVDLLLRAGSAARAKFAIYLAQQIVDVIVESESVAQNK